MSVGSRIAKARNAKGLSQGALGRLVNVGQTTIQGWEADRNEPDLDKLQLMAEHLDKSAAWLAFGDAFMNALSSELGGISSAYLRVPFNDIGAGAGGPRLAGEADDGQTILLPESLVTHQLRAAPDHLVAFPVHGQSMSPLLPDGTVVVADMRKRQIGGGGLFGIDDGDGLVVKWVEKIRDSDPPKLRFVSENKSISPYERLAEEAGIIGLIVWRMGRVE